MIFTFFLLISIFPYTKISLNKKNCLGFGFLRQILVKTPSPTNTRPGTAKGWINKYKYYSTFK
jgi:hypothetical protein